jgi:cytochrome c biogenesis protein CcdA
MGLGVRRLTSAVQKVNPIFQKVAGVLLIVLGFYLLATP